MPRLARKSLESSYFHVIVQGYEKEYIFDENNFKKEYLRLLFNENKKFDVEILEYCIMGNHAHILLYCSNTEQMSLFMKNVNTLYASFYNKVKNRVGYVFRDRFLSEAIMNEKHLYNCIPYIHMNPVEANIVAKPQDYLYSSFNDFVYKRGIVTDSVLIKLFGCKDGYLDLFYFLHMSNGDGIDFKKDDKKIDLSEAERIIKEILNDYCICNLKNEEKDIQRYFFEKFIKKRISIYHMEKILQIDHRKIRRYLEK